MKKLDAGNRILTAIGIVITTIALLSLTPVVVDAVQDLNTTSWTFMGAEGAKSLLGLVPFVWIASILISAVVGMVLLSRQSGGGKQ